MSSPEAMAVSIKEETTVPVEEDVQEQNGQLTEIQVKELVKQRIEEEIQPLREENEALRKDLDALRVLVEEIKGQARPRSYQKTTVTPMVVDMPGFPGRTWIHEDGKIRRVPPTWKFPFENLLNSYKIWHLDDTVQGICAAKHLRPTDVDFVSRGKKNLEEFKFIMNRLDIAAKALDLLKQKMTEDEVEHAFKESFPALGIAEMTSTGKPRDFAKFKWTSAIRIMPIKKRVPQDGNFVQPVPFDGKTWSHEDGKDRRVPATWVFPELGLLASYKLWHLGDNEIEVSPFKFLRPVDIDFLEKGTEKLEQYRSVMLRLDAGAGAIGVLKENMTETDIDESFKGCLPALKISREPPDGGDFSSLKWTEAFAHLGSQQDGAFLTEQAAQTMANMAVASTPVPQSASIQAGIDAATETANMEGETVDNIDGAVLAAGVEAALATAPEAGVGATVSSEPVKDEQGVLCWIHSGGMRRVPQDWVFPCENLLQMYKLWHLGDGRVCPLKHIRPKDVNHIKRGRQNLEEVRFMMTMLDLDANNKGLLKSIMKEQDAVEAFEQCLPALTIPEATNTGKPRNTAKMKWSSALRIMKVKKRTPQKGGYVRPVGEGGDDDTDMSEMDDIKREIAAEIPPDITPESEPEPMAAHLPTETQDV
eukprot:CAMPEP_0202453246 /NCGR_PEP_ID=MMETSP1360-20130828/11260_1 /ASSEMBLY_ACC=CAM_ASM_000848 /TAXON_ID=515479 /ORGANISM="Licmophora paradoxa, Strain CCMP2313" /LENGTH=647 /DNA_ID=CAMNT_0049072285 /DNA_START=54 /DNA_END=1997 /DNA_ORIENTATION=+